MQPAEGAFDVARWTADLAADSGTPSNAAALHAGRVTLTRASGHGFLQVCGHAPPAWRTPWIRPGGQIVTDCDQFALTAGVRTPMVSRAAATSGAAARIGSPSTPRTPIATAGTSVMLIDRPAALTLWAAVPVVYGLGGVALVAVPPQPAYRAARDRCRRSRSGRAAFSTEPRAGLGRTAVAARWRRCLTSGRHRWRCHRRGRVAHVLALPGRHHHTGPIRPAVAGH